MNIMDITYISLGESCAVAYNLDRLKKRVLAFPFDWSKIKLKDLNKVLSNDFKDYDKVEIVKLSENHRDLEEFKQPTYIIKNPYNITMAHEVVSVNITETGEIPEIIETKLEEFKIKLQRRIERFRDTLKNKIKFIRLEISPFKQTYIQELDKLVSILDKLCPDYELTIICHISYQDKITNKKIKIEYFDKFSEDWRYLNIDWQKLIF